MPVAPEKQRIPPFTVLVALALGAFVFRDALTWLGSRWIHDPFYSHGFFVPIIAIWLWYRGDGRIPWMRTWMIWPIAGMIGLLHFVGSDLEIPKFSAVAIPLAGIASAGILAGRSAMARAAGPALYLYLALPLPKIVIQQISLPLQLASSWMATTVFEAVGVTVERIGVHVAFSEFTLTIVDACSGLQSVIAVVGVVTFAALYYRLSFRRTCILLAASLGIALLANFLRIFGSGLVGLTFGGRAATVIFERFSAILFYAVVGLSLLVLADRLRQDEPDPAERPSKPGPPPLRRWGVVYAFIGALLLMGLFLPRERTVSFSPVFSSWTPEIQGWEVTPGAEREPMPREEIVQFQLKAKGKPTVHLAIRHGVNSLPVHSPEFCSLAAGWIPYDQSQITHTSTGPIPAQQMLASREGYRSALIYWHYLDGEVSSGTMRHLGGDLIRQFVRRNARSVYVELGILLEDGKDADRLSLLRQLAPEIDRLIQIELNR